jgi:adenosylmethionine-8-amino-7-oxononanoate aminotransferase
MDSRRAQQFEFVPSNFPTLVVERTEGVWFFTDSGARILDAGGGAVVTNIGHGRREIVEEATRALSRLDYVIPMAATEARVRLVEELMEHWLPAGFTRCKFMAGGSESVDAAIRLARTQQVSVGQEGRWKILGRDVSYHGSTLGGLSAGSHDRRRAGFGPLLSPFPKVPWLDASGLEDIIEQEGADTIAAFIGEPVTGAAGGAMVPPDDYWPTVADICRRNGILMIADEVMTGFGRTGLAWGHQHFGYTPDIIVAGKGLSGGYAPMGGVYTTEDIVKPVAAAGMELMYYTFSGYDLGCAISRRVLELIREEHLVERAAEVGQRLHGRLVDTLGSHRNVLDIRGRGLLLGIELVQDRDGPIPFPRDLDFARRVVFEALSRGVWVYPAGSGPVADALLIGPPFTLEDDHIELLVGVLNDSITAVADSL